MITMMMMMNDNDMLTPTPELEGSDLASRDLGLAGAHTPLLIPTHPF